MKQFLSIILVFLALIAVSCNKKESTSSSSSVAKLNTFKFASNDSIPGLGAAVFTVKELGDTGRVWNEDSILYGTPLNRVVPKFTFAATPSSAVMYVPMEGDSLKKVILTGSDTVDFTRQPVYLTLVSQDETKSKTYKITAVVHKVDPDLFEWQCLQKQVFEEYCEQQTLMLGSEFVTLTNSGTGVKVYSSADGATWSDNGAASGLETSCHVRQVISDGTTLYYVNQTTLYTSTDGVTWTATAMGLSGKKMHTMLMVFNEAVWVVTEDESTGKLYMDSISSSLALAETGLELDAKFPIGSFATVNFPSASGRAHALVLGGYTRDGESLNSRWAFEYSGVEDTIRVKNFTIEQPNFTCLTGASMVWYDNKIYLFGGINDDAQLQDQTILVSRDEGMNWTTPDTTKCRLPEEYAIRQKQSALVRDNNIYLFSGESRTDMFSDVYKGRLNSIDW